MERFPGEIILYNMASTLIFCRITFKLLYPELHKGRCTVPNLRNIGIRRVKSLADLYRFLLTFLYIVALE